MLHGGVYIIIFTHIKWEYTMKRKKKKFIDRQKWHTNYLINGHVWLISRAYITHRHLIYIM